MKFFFILFFLLLKCCTNILALRKVEARLDPTTKADGKFASNDLLNYKSEIYSQMERIKGNRELSNGIDLELKELNDLTSLINKTQEKQKSSLINYSQFLEQTKLSLYKILNEYENRINQIEYNIMELKKYDPFIEKFNYPISMYWVKIDFNNFESLWKYKKNKNYISIIQENNTIDIKNNIQTILLLKHHNILDGYIHVDLLQISSSPSQVKQMASGIIFHFLNSRNFRVLELSFFNNRAILMVIEVSNNVYKKIVSRAVTVENNEFNSLTLQFDNKKINIFLNYKKVIELNVTVDKIINQFGLFTKNGAAEFKNILTGNIDFEKLVMHTLINSNDKDVAKGYILDSFRFSKKMEIDDLSVYAIPYTNKDYDTPFKFEIDNVYPVPDSNSYYNDKQINKFPTQNSDNISSENDNTLVEQGNDFCYSYKEKNYNLDEWICQGNYNARKNNIDEGKCMNWKIINEYNIYRIVFINDYKNNNEIKSKLLYKYSSCNSVYLSAYIKLENNSEAGLIYRYDNEENMYIASISIVTKQLTLKKYKNGIEQIIKTKFIKNINYFQRIHILIHDQGELGTMDIYIDSVKLININNQHYYKLGQVGLIVEQGYATFDTFMIEPTTNRNINDIISLGNEI
ncbi:hypothetical protein YYG_00173 [Plasmodium vinckei petteri]|uniref:LCCL domain-containing protein n=1 Tax=Plasmodium vinckei petteri TaxID=138298 RepID=W7B865_PLAVN|nr:hypothetical protein YYG_00173 [Plasmodium vinckei petteri]CAD2113300.1 conserved Plasmodium protein, unknown function [Plasmodium vinckei petteri]